MLVLQVGEDRSQIGVIDEGWEVCVCVCVWGWGGGGGGVSG